LNVVAAHPFVVFGLFATSTGAMYVDRHRLPGLCKKGGAELEPFTGRLTSRAIALAATC
jgi:hypothetical protein